jgi:hypothetical protein
LAGLRRAIDELPDFPGPRSHAIDERASARYGYEVRRMLYYGPTRRRTGTPYRVLFTMGAPPSSPGRTGKSRPNPGRTPTAVRANLSRRSRGSIRCLSPWSRGGNPRTAGGTT